MTKQITIQGVTVELSEPYAAGHAITEAEAKALNQVRAENIRNNRAKAVKELLDAKGGDVNAVQAEVQAMIAAYEAEYEFTMAAAGGSTTRVDPLTKECRAIARNYITGKIRESGMTLKDYKEKNGEDAIENKVMELADHPKIVEAAKRTLKEREKLGALADELNA